MNDLHTLMERAMAEQPPLSITRETAVAAGRRALRRRRQVTAVLGIAAAAAVAAGVTAVPHVRGTGTPIGGPSATVSTYEVPQMPAAVIRTIASSACRVGIGTSIISIAPRAPAVFATAFM